MNEWNVFLTIGTVFGFVAAMYTMIYKPTHELKVEIVKLNSNLESLRTSDVNQNKKIDKHDEEIGKLKVGHASLEKDVRFIKDRIN